MSRTPIHVCLAAAVGLAVASLPMSASAVTKWRFKSSDCFSQVPGGGCSGEFADSRVYNVYSGSGDKVEVTAWANTASPPAAPNSNTLLERGEIAQYSGGLGVRNADWNRSVPDSNENNPPEHAVDNNERFDLVLFDFGTQQVSLTEVSLGWIQSDADISVLAYTGSGDPSDLSGITYSEFNEDLTAQGWELVGNYDVDWTDPNSPYVQDITTSISSSYWLVGAYNPVFPGCETPYCNLHPNDYMKILKLGGNIDDPTPPVGVPEPATPLLLLAGVVPLLRRRLAPWLKSN